MNLFTLKPLTWYALQLLEPGNKQQELQSIPAFVHEVLPRKTGKNVLGLHLYTLSERMVLECHVLQRSDKFLLASASPDTVVIVQPIAYEWIQQFYPELLDQPNGLPDARYKSELTFFLDRIARTPVAETRFAGYRGDIVTFRCSDFRRAEAVGLSLVVEGENLLELRRKATSLLAFYKSEWSEPHKRLRFEIDYQERNVLTACALRFDGYDYIDTAQRGDSRLVKEQLDRHLIPEDLSLRLATFFHLQRYLMKWGGEMLPLHGPEWRHFRELFLSVVNEPVPPQYQYAEYYEDWLTNYEPFRAQCIEVVRAIHESTSYDDNAPPEMS